MPDLSQEKIDELQITLERYLEKKSDRRWEISFLAAGGSAAVFRGVNGEEKRAFKVFDPRFISNEEGSKEQERLGLQRRLIKHDCDHLVQTFLIENFDDTAVIEMEYVEWPRLKEVLKDVPDDSVEILIRQLVSAVLYLEGHGIVHRDIKPENIHVSECWKKLKLLDLGVVREFDPGPGAADTDQGAQRPFLATAQYSSPEYLFRLDEPSRELWQGLNIYQVGAVLHDLIMKEPLFRAEIEADNRWLVAKAVLLNPPNFKDGNPSRLIYLKSLAAKCLSKDLQARLTLVNWLDFEVQEHNVGLNKLRARLKSRPNKQTDPERALSFERGRFQESLIDKVKLLLISACGTDLPLTVFNTKASNKEALIFQFAHSEHIVVETHICFDWKAGLYARSVDILASGYIYQPESVIAVELEHLKLIGSISMDDAIDDAGSIIAESIADIVETAISDVESYDSVAGSIESLYGKQIKVKRMSDER
ncbi:protein kinase [Pseudomonas sp. 50_B]|uniref:protein kinase domain-containing protein n=1 Tax=Pseudomonas sp. 50_B TaxID=2813574 RepID=UPI001A9F4559|nr:protein kinase [Pseudomonas sp. 50_B]